MRFYSPGIRIADRYEIAGRPMMGGMGIVYFCLGRAEDRPVVLKTFRPEFLPDRASRDRFLREGTHWVRLGAHPHIVRCYEVLRIDPEVFLVLELVAKDRGREDASLRSWLTPGTPLPAEQALLFALQIVRGMQHAVEKIPGFVHRDLKPENVLVGADRLSGAVTVNRLRVIDFGLAMVLERAGGWPSAADRPGHEDRTGLGQTQLTRGVVGTPLYMAPEQWRGDRLGVWTDVYALGCILYEMVAGQRTVEGQNLGDLWQAHCEGRRRPLPGGVAPDAAKLVARCLALAPGERYRSWEAVGTALGEAYEAVTGKPVPAPEPAIALSQVEDLATGWSYSAIAGSYMDIGKAEVAVGYLERALQVGRAAGERRLEAAGLTHLGLAYARLGDARQAIGCHEGALAISREMGSASRNDAERAEARRDEGAELDNLGLAYAALGDARRAAGYHEQARAIARQLGDQQGEAASLSNLGLAYARLGDAQQAAGCHQQALAIARELGDRRSEGASLCNLGLAYRKLGDTGPAIDYLDQALAIARELGDRRGEGSTLGNLGETHRQMGDARRAIGYHEQALAVHREIGDRWSEATTLGNLGIAYLQAGDARRAIGCSEQALTIAREIGDRQGEGRALANLGSAYAELGDFMRAMEYHRPALRINREIGDALTATMVSVNLALALAMVGRESEAIPLLEQAIRDFRQGGYLQHAQRAEQMLAEVRGGGAKGVSPVSAQVMQQLEPVIAAAVDAARGDSRARAAVEASFDGLEQAGWLLAEPIRRLWAGERDEARLTAGLDDSDTFIVREILERLQG